MHFCFVPLQQSTILHCNIVLHWIQINCTNCIVLCFVQSSDNISSYLPLACSIINNLAFCILCVCVCLCFALLLHRCVQIISFICLVGFHHKQTLILVLSQWLSNIRCIRWRQFFVHYVLVFVFVLRLFYVLCVCVFCKLYCYHAVMKGNAEIWDDWKLIPVITISSLITL